MNSLNNAKSYGGGTSYSERVLIHKILCVDESTSDEVEDHSKSDESGSRVENGLPETWI